MNEKKDQESSALDEVMVARIEIEGIGVAANEKEMSDAVTALPGVREVKIENGDMQYRISLDDDGTVVGALMTMSP